MVVCAGLSRRSEKRQHWKRILHEMHLRKVILAAASADRGMISAAEMAASQDCSRADSFMYSRQVIREYERSGRRRGGEWT